MFGKSALLRRIEYLESRIEELERQTAIGITDNGTVWSAVASREVHVNDAIVAIIHHLGCGWERAHQCGNELKVMPKVRASIK